MSSESELEQKIQDKGLTAPRLTPGDIDNLVANKQFHVFDGSQLTVCCITLQNGYTVTGTSACASPENFNKEIGEDIAFENARDEIWAVAGYALKESLYRESLNVDGADGFCAHPIEDEQDVEPVEFFGMSRLPAFTNANRQLNAHMRDFIERLMEQGQSPENECAGCSQCNKTNPCDDEERSRKDDTVSIDGENCYSEFHDGVKWKLFPLPELMLDEVAEKFYRDDGKDVCFNLSGSKFIVMAIHATGVMLAEKESDDDVKTSFLPLPEDLLDELSKSALEDPDKDIILGVSGELLEVVSIIDDGVNVKQYKPKVKITVTGKIRED